MQASFQDRKPRQHWMQRVCRRGTFHRTSPMWRAASKSYQLINCNSLQTRI